MKLLQLLILLPAVLLIGCRPLKDLSPATYSKGQLDEEEYHELDGFYHNDQDTVFGSIEHAPYRGIDENDLALLERLFLIVPPYGTSPATSVQIEMLSKRKALVRGYKSDSLIFTKTMRGKMKNGYFYLRPKMYLVPFFPIFYVHNFERVRIRKSGADLLVDHTKMLWGFAIMAGGSDYGRSTSVYESEFDQ